jgi:hypothetical protein
MYWKSVSAQLTNMTLFGTCKVKSPSSLFALLEFLNISRQDLKVVLLMLGGDHAPIYNNNSPVKHLQEAADSESLGYDFSLSNSKRE